MEQYQVGNEMSPERSRSRSRSFLRWGQNISSTVLLIIMLALLTVMCALVLTANAQVPRTISYQGVLTNGGALAEGPHLITVSLYDSLEGGTQLYQESHPLTVTNGIFEMEIGSISPLPPTLTFGVPYYLGVSIDGSAELSPRVPLDAAPYALNAGTAQLAEGLTPDAHGVVTSINELAGALRISGDSITTVTENGNEITIHATAAGIRSIASPDKTIAIANATGPNVTVGVADSAITTAKLANAAVTPQKLAQAGAKKGQILKWNGSAWTVANDSAGSASYIAGQGISISGNTISASGGLPAGTVLNSTLRWNGTSWTENQNMTSDANGNTRIDGTTNLGDGIGSDNITMSPGMGQIQVNGWNQGVVMSNAMGVLSTSQLTGGAGISITQNANAITIADTGSVGWALTGNVGTIAPTNFLGTIDDQPFEIHINNNDGAAHGSKRVLRFEPNATSANIIAGYQGNAANANVVGATIAGGGLNGFNNTVTDDFGTVGGGSLNRAGNNSGSDQDASHATVAGGGGNTASGIYSSILGGTGNTASSNSATVSGGSSNQATGAYATVTGGIADLANDSVAVVGGGGNTAGKFSTIPGGRNLTLGQNSFGVNVNGSGNTIDLSANQNLAYFGDMDLWLGNLDNSASAIRFYAPGTNVNYSTRPYSAFLAGTQSATINYTLPITQPSANQVLTATNVSGTGPYNVTMGWTTPSGGGSAWDLSGNSGTTAGTNFLGTTDNQAFEIHVYDNDAANKGSKRVMRFEPNATSANIIGGYSGNRIAILGQVGDIIAGGGANSFLNTIVSGNYCTISGGSNNNIGGGYDNATVGGGYSNNATGFASVVAGGMEGYAYGRASAVGGGYGIWATGDFSAGAGGYEDSAKGDYSFVGSGYQNATTVGASYSVIAGGDNNKITGNGAYSGILAGLNNSVTGSYGMIGGGYDDTAGVYSVVSGGVNNKAGEEAGVTNGYATISGGELNSANGVYSTVSGGTGNSAESGSAIPGGVSLQLGDYSFGYNSGGGSGGIGANLNASGAAYSNIAYFGNVNLWIGNTGSYGPGQLRFYQTNSGTTYPSSVYYSSFQAPTSYANGVINYTLPSSQPTANQVLSATAVSGAGPYAVTLGWADASGNAWSLTGNSGTTDGTNFLGTTDNVPFTIRANNVQALRIQPYHNAVPSMIGGGSHNTIVSGDTASFIGFGDSNRVGASYSAIVGGNSDTVTGDYSTISAGYGNTLTGEVSAISGGAGNSITSDFSMIAGGYLDTIPGTYDGFIGAGAYNVVKDENGAIAGGELNIAYLNAFVGGGIANLAGAFSHSSSAILGGSHNWAAGDNSIIAGGQSNQVPLDALYSGILAGVSNYAGGSNSAIIGGGYLRMTGDNSFGFHAGTSSTDSAAISTANTAYFGNVNLWLGNTNNTASELRFYGAQNGGVTFPGASTHYSSFAAAGQLADINYTLPSTQPSANQVLAATSVSGTGPYAVTLGWADNSSSGSVIYGPTSLQATLTPRTTPLFNIAYLSTAADANAVGASITSSAGASGNYNATGLTVTATGTGTGNTTGITVSASGSSGTVRAIDATGKINIDDQSSYDIGGTPYLWEKGENLFLGNTEAWPNNATITGSDNIFIGLYTASNISSGGANVVLGQYAGEGLSTGDNNIIVGLSAGNATSSGDWNTFVGDECGMLNSVGHDNSYYGHEAGYSSLGDSNSFFGSTAGGQTTFDPGYTGSNNSLFGYHSAFIISSGTNNTILGSMAGQTVTTGSDNTLLGAGSNISSGSLTNSAAIGYRSYVAASNSLVLGSINGINGATANTYVGIGTTSPAYPLHSVYSGTTDEITAIYGNATGTTANQAIGVWGDASNTSTTNTGTIGVLATGNENTTEGQTNVALQINDGEFAMGRTTEAPGTGTDVEAATGGTAYTQQGPSGIIELTLGAAGNLATAAPASGAIQDLGAVTINNRYCETGSIVLVNVVGMIDDGSAPNPQNAAWIVNADNTTGGSFVVRIKMIPTQTSASNYTTSDKIRIGYMIVNKSR